MPGAQPVSNDLNPAAKSVLVICLWKYILRFTLVRNNEALGNTHGMQSGLCVSNVSKSSM